MNKPNILLTGGSGFIGRNIIEQRKNAYNIISPSHKELDLLDTEKVHDFFKKNKIDIVLHCANIGGLRSNLNLDKVIRNNLRIFFNIVRNKNKFKKMINFGSGAEYDKSRDIKKVKEIDFEKKIPNDDYGFYKYICSKYIENSQNIYCLRLFGIFGKYEDYKVKFISNLICKYIYKRPLTMVQNAYFDYIDIDDFIKILDYFILQTPQYKFYNIGTGRRISLLSIAKKINRLDKYSLPIKDKQKGFGKEYSCNNERLMNELRIFDFTRFTRIEDSIKKLYSFYQKNINNIDKKAILEDKYNK